MITGTSNSDFSSRVIESSLTSCTVAVVIALSPSPTVVVVESLTGNPSFTSPTVCASTRSRCTGRARRRDSRTTHCDCSGRSTYHASISILNGVLSHTLQAICLTTVVFHVAGFEAVHRLPFERVGQRRRHRDDAGLGLRAADRRPGSMRRRPRSRRTSSIRYFLAAVFSRTERFKSHCSRLTTPGNSTRCGGGPGDRSRSPRPWGPCVVTVLNRTSVAGFGGSGAGLAAAGARGRRLGGRRGRLRRRRRGFGLRRRRFVAGGLAGGGCCVPVCWLEANRLAEKIAESTRTEDGLTISDLRGRGSFPLRGTYPLWGKQDQCLGAECSVLGAGSRFRVQNPHQAPEPSARRQPYLVFLPAFVRLLICRSKPSGVVV